MINVTNSPFHPVVTTPASVTATIEVTTTTSSSARPSSSAVSNVRAVTTNTVVLPPANVSLPPPQRSISQSDDALPKYKRDLVAKIKVLKRELGNLQPQNGHCRLEVSRQEVFEESYRQIVKMRPKDMRKRLMIKFRGEDGLDYGGVAREWLHLLSHEMLNPYYGLFQYSREDIYTLQINAESGINPDHLSYFHFVGRIIGVALFHGHYIDGGFTMPFYKMLLNKSVNLADIEDVDPSLHASLRWILDNDITEVLEDTTFSVETEAYGLVQSHELKKGGKDTQVGFEI